MTDPVFIIQKPLFSLQREMIITSRFNKLTKATNKFKIDIKQISDWLEISKNIISSNNRFYFVLH